ncbi:cytochrome b/b6 domain-containing protein [Streptomyces sp. NBC_01498]|uniref:cytochrome b/b6 domain-containing protein n=1 Tax=Streptomyces sp. NBC_01498 TaxID=2975870 RepID=UPI002E7B59A0|nr:cytochrome b/b6 domain-containing protein [Streptomyces sp. NBC_01498]WTL27666.1 cytochrome b/b6 domain-containing protein [Streptomyces sp. NBC_01498]
MTSTPGSGGPTAVPTPRPSERPDASDLPDRSDAPGPPTRSPLRRRFSRAERLVHRTTAGLALLCVATAACLYVPQLAELVGRRALVVTLHQWSGLLLPAPFLAGLLSPSFRADLRRLNRFAPYDREWLRAARRRDSRPGARPAGKFNAGQKLYGGWIAGAVLVMLATGLLMWFTWLTPLVWRTSATFVHDWLSLAVGLVLAGHIGMAYADPEARRGMRTGSVERPWAEREHPHWEEEKEEKKKVDEAEE